VIDDDIETIESGYEYLLAFAAQGRPAQVETGPGPHARPTIEGMAAAMKNIVAAFTDSEDDFEKLIASDCGNAGAALGFILKQDKIGSEMVDNLNASIHLRAVLTDLFLYSEVLKPLATEQESPVQTYDATSQKAE
jgi:hypothetical protein